MVFVYSLFLSGGEFVQREGGGFPEIQLKAGVKKKLQKVYYGLIDRHTKCEVTQNDDANRDQLRHASWLVCSAGNLLVMKLKADMQMV